MSLVSFRGTLNPEEDRDGGPRTVIVSHQLWHTAFQSDPHILGKSVLAKGEFAACVAHGTHSAGSAVAC